MEELILGVEARSAEELIKHTSARESSLSGDQTVQQVLRPRDAE